MISQSNISAAGQHLWNELVSEFQVKYSRYYNHNSGAAKTLAKSIVGYIENPVEDDEQDLLDEGHLLIEYAARQLNDIGATKITMLTELLVDGGFDYQIELTPKGWLYCKTELDFCFRGPEHTIIATPASNWIIDFLDGCPPNGALTLRDVVKYGHSECEIEIRDKYFPLNSYGCGTGSYIWAFEVSLWHHAKEGNIQPVCKTNEQRRAWLNMTRLKGRPDLPSPHFDNPLWDVPFRLRAEVDVRKVSHVGSVSEM